ncbi:MAG: hypothetical protein Q4G09_02550 [Clostridia bacterium]|nr:hypothetical protein [Clostridia bacterium]
MSKENMIKREIQDDIKEIEQVLENSNNTEELKQIHIKVDGKYQSKIKNWGLSCYNWNEKFGFDYELCSDSSLRHNLLNMQRKLEGYLQDFSLVVMPQSKERTVNYYNTNSNNNTNSNTNTIKLDFKIIENTVTNMESLNDEETKEALQELKELEEIYKSTENRKSKWTKCKKILLWLADKSVDVAIAFIPIIKELLEK